MLQGKRGTPRKGGRVWGSEKSFSILTIISVPGNWRWCCVLCSGRDLVTNSSCLHSEHLALQRRRSALFTPFPALMVQSAVQCPIHHSPVWPPSLFFPLSPSLVLLFLLFSLHLFIKLMRLKLGPSLRGGGGGWQRAKEDTSREGGRALKCITVCAYRSAGTCAWVFVCLSN